MFGHRKQQTVFRRSDQLWSGKSLLRMIKGWSFKRPYEQFDCFTINHTTVVLSFDTWLSIL
jgi:hypothetical protein